AEDGIRDFHVTGVQTCALPISAPAPKAGSVVVFDCNTMHGSNGNITPYGRSNAFVVFNAWSNRLVAPFGETRPRPEFIAHREVAEPIAPARRAAARRRAACAAGLEPAGRATRGRPPRASRPPLACRRGGAPGRARTPLATPARTRHNAGKC